MILKQIEQSQEESRRNRMLWIFKQAGSNNSRNEKYPFRQPDNQPVQLNSVSFTLTKLNYIHDNPVKAGWVEKPDDYLLINARDYHGSEGLFPIKHLTAHL